MYINHTISTMQILIYKHIYWSIFLKLLHQIPKDFYLCYNKTWKLVITKLNLIICSFTSTNIICKRCKIWLLKHFLKMWSWHPLDKKLLIINDLKSSHSFSNIADLIQHKKLLCKGCLRIGHCIVSSCVPCIVSLSPNVSSKWISLFINISENCLVFKNIILITKTLSIWYNNNKLPLSQKWMVKISFIVIPTTSFSTPWRHWKQAYS